MTPLRSNSPSSEGYSPAIERTLLTPLAQLAFGGKDHVETAPEDEIEAKLKAFERLQAWAIARDDVVEAQNRENELHGTDIDPTTTSAYLLADSFYQAADKAVWALHGLDGPSEARGTGLIEEF